MARAAADSNAAERVSEFKTWDPLVRLTHWGIAAAVLLNGLVVEDGSLVHVWLGYARLSPCWRYGSSGGCWARRKPASLHFPQASVQLSVTPPISWLASGNCIALTIRSAR